MEPGSKSINSLYIDQGARAKEVEWPYNFLDIDTYYHLSSMCSSRASVDDSYNNDTLIQYKIQYTHHGYVALVSISQTTSTTI